MKCLFKESENIAVAFTLARKEIRPNLTSLKAHRFAEQSSLLPLMILLLVAVIMMMAMMLMRVC